MTLLAFIKESFRRRESKPNSTTLMELSERFDPSKRLLMSVGKFTLPIFNRIPRIECKDGFSLSAQVGITEHCIPRDINGPWSHVEIGYPSNYESLLDPYGSDGEVYNYVPIEVLVMIIDMHGGLKPINVIEEGVVIEGEFYVAEAQNPLEGLFAKKLST